MVSPIRSSRTTIYHLDWSQEPNLTKNRQEAQWQPSPLAFFFLLHFLYFSTSYCPGSRNVKPDALSRQFATNNDPPETATILPATFMVASSPGASIHQALQDEPDPGTSLPNHCYVPIPAPSAVIHWVHTTK